MVNLSPCPRISGNGLHVDSTHNLLLLCPQLFDNIHVYHAQVYCVLSMSDSVSTELGFPSTTG